MTRVRKSKKEAIWLGTRLRQQRKDRLLTLEMVAAATGVDAGQLSRFERGDFAVVSGNLQIVAKYLQVPTATPLDDSASQLLLRFESILRRSDRHQEAARALVSALERLE